MRFSAHSVASPQGALPPASTDAELEARLAALTAERDAYEKEAEIAAGAHAAHVAAAARADARRAKLEAAHARAAPLLRLLYAVIAEPRSVSSALAAVRAARPDLSVVREGCSPRITSPIIALSPSGSALGAASPTVKTSFVSFTPRAEERVPSPMAVSGSGAFILTRASAPTDLTQTSSHMPSKAQRAAATEAAVFAALSGAVVNADDDGVSGNAHDSGRPTFTSPTALELSVRRIAIGRSVNEVLVRAAAIFSDIAAVVPRDAFSAESPIASHQHPFSAVSPLLTPTLLQSSLHVPSHVARIGGDNLPAEAGGAKHSSPSMTSALAGTAARSETPPANLRVRWRGTSSGQKSAASSPRVGFRIMSSAENCGETEDLEGGGARFSAPLRPSSTPHPRARASVISPAARAQRPLPSSPLQSPSQEIWNASDLGTFDDLASTLAALVTSAAERIAAENSVDALLAEPPPAFEAYEAVEWSRVAGPSPRPPPLPPTPHRRSMAPPGPLPRTSPRSLQTPHNPRKARLAPAIPPTQERASPTSNAAEAQDSSLVRPHAAATSSAQPDVRPPLSRVPAAQLPAIALSATALAAARVAAARRALTANDAATRGGGGARSLIRNRSGHAAFSRPALAPVRIVASAPALVEAPVAKYSAKSSPVDGTRPPSAAAAAPRRIFAALAQFDS